MAIQVELLRKLCAVPGAPGDESRVREIVMEEIRDYVEEMRVDNMGNLIALRKGVSSDKKVMAAAHMDEISFIVSHIDKEGFIRFQPLGGFDPKTLTAQRVLVHGKVDLIGVMGSKPIHIMSPEERNKAPKLKDYFIDMGMSADKVKELVSIGDFITRERDLIEIGDCVSSKSLDNRVSVYILIESLRRMQKPAYDFYATFTVQEEVGLRGATTAARQVNPDFAFGLDITIANDLPGSADHEKVTEIGKGTAIKIVDGSVISDVRMVRYMEEVATRHNISYQKEVLPKGGTDTGALQRSGDGAIAGCVSIPTRHVHSVVELCHKEDIDLSIDLLARCVEELDQFQLAW